MRELFAADGDDAAADATAGVAGGLTEVINFFVQHDRSAPHGICPAADAKGWQREIQHACSVRSHLDVAEISCVGAGKTVRGKEPMLHAVRIIVSTRRLSLVPAATKLVDVQPMLARGKIRHVDDHMEAFRGVRQRGRAGHG